jgi:hypothetical protein
MQDCNISMKFIRPRLGLCAWALAAIFFGAAVFHSYAAEPATAEPAHKATQALEMTVQVKLGQIRKSPSAVAPIIATAPYRQRLKVLGSGNGWVKVALPEGQGYGYIYASALSSVQIPQSFSPAPGQGAAPGVSGTEIALAGKGFNTELEEYYGEKASVRFEWVDFMEGFDYEAGSCIGFLGGEGTR